MLVRSSAEDSVHIDLHTSNSLCISLQAYTYFFIFSFFLFFFTLPFFLFFLIFLERHRNQSQVIIKAQQNQQTKYCYSSFSDWLAHKHQPA